MALIVAASGLLGEGCVRACVCAQLRMCACYSRTWVRVEHAAGGSSTALTACTAPYAAKHNLLHCTCNKGRTLTLLKYKARLRTTCARYNTESYVYGYSDCAVMRAECCSVCPAQTPRLNTHRIHYRDTNDCYTNRTWCINNATEGVCRNETSCATVAANGTW